MCALPVGTGICSFQQRYRGSATSLGCPEHTDEYDIQSFYLLMELTSQCLSLGHHVYYK